MSEWIKHDGAEPIIPDGAEIQMMFDITCGGHSHDDGSIRFDHPCWYWRWKRVRVDWFRTARRRVCDNPAYAPIVAYRFCRSEGYALVEAIAKAPHEFKLEDA